MAVPEEFGGGGVKDFRYNAIITEETTAGGYSGVGFTLHNDVVAPYLLDLANDEQKQRWLPGFCSGELITAIAMTEPGTGSDLQGIKTTRSSRRRPLGPQRVQDVHHQRHQRRPRHRRGMHRPGQGRAGLQPLVVERGMPGFERGRNLDKIGMKAQDTAELQLHRRSGSRRQPARRRGNGLPLPDAEPSAGTSVDRSGRCRGHGVRPRDDRSSTAATARRSASRSAASRTPASCWPNWRRRRRPSVSSSTSSSSSSTPSKLTVQEAAMAKWWTTEAQVKLIDRCLQLHGGYGYMKRIPGCQGVHGLPRADDLRRHDRNHEGNHRTRTLNL